MPIHVDAGTGLLTVSGVPNRVPDPRASIADAPAVVDALTQLGRFVLADPAVAADVITSITMLWSVADSVSVDDDVISRTGNFTDDVTNVADQLAIIFKGVVADSAGVADAMTQLGVRQLAEAQTALDTIVQLGVLNTIADSVAVADAIAMISDFSRAESVTAVDQMTPFANMARTESATATDVLGIIDLNTILVFSRPGEFSIGASIMGAAKTPPAPVPWTPAMLPNAKAWFISDSPSNTLVSGELSILADLSGGGFHASAYGGSATNRATLANTLNGRAVWGGDGSSKLAAFQLGGAANAMLNNASGATIFSVHRKTGGADGVLGLWTKNGDFGRARFTLGRSQTSGGDLEAGGRRLDGDGYQGTGDASDQGTGWMIAAGIGDFVNRSLSTWINGTQKFSSSSWQTSGNTSATDSQIALVGAYGTGGGIAGTLVGDQAEVLMIVGALSVADRQNVEGYLAWRWGMQASLPAGHPYKTAAP